MVGIELRSLARFHGGYGCQLPLEFVYPMRTLITSVGELTSVARNPAISEAEKCVTGASGNPRLRIKIWNLRIPYRQAKGGGST